MSQRALIACEDMRAGYYLCAGITLTSIVALVLALLAVPLIATAQQATTAPRLGVLTRSTARGLNAFRHGLQELGYVEGQNLVMEWRYAERPEQAPALAAELVRLGVEVLVTHGPSGVRAAMAATRTIPIVVGRMDDADEQGFVTTLGQPGGNVTGLSFQTGELSGKWLELLTEAVPSASRFTVLWDATGTVNQRRTLERAAHALGVQLHVLEVRSVDDIDGAFAAAQTAQAEGLVILASPLLTDHAARLAALAAQQRLPAIYYNRRFAQAGGLMAYGPQESDPSWGWHRAAYYVDRILKGARPSDLPVEQPTKFELVINLQTAQALGLTVPPLLLFQADEVLR
jgi:putative ABC transport system substrate-binding protein